VTSALKTRSYIFDRIQEEEVKASSSIAGAPALKGIGSIKLGGAKAGGAKAAAAKVGASGAAKAAGATAAKVGGAALLGKAAAATGGAALAGYGAYKLHQRFNKRARQLHLQKKAKKAEASGNAGKAHILKAKLNAHVAKHGDRRQTGVLDKIKKGKQLKLYGKMAAHQASGDVHKAAIHRAKLDAHMSKHGDRANLTTGVKK